LRALTADIRVATPSENLPGVVDRPSGVEFRNDAVPPIGARKAVVAAIKVTRSQQ